MRKLYNEFFCIPKNEKINDRVMLVRLATTVIIMLACLVVMSVTAYAYFTYNVTSGSNYIKSANFDASVVITTTEDSSSVPVAVTKQENSSYTADLKAGKIYTVTLDKNTESSAKTGFFIVSAVGCPDVYRTQQLGVDAGVDGGATEKVTFQLKVTADVTVRFISNWGTSSGYGSNGRLYVTNNHIGNNKVVMVVNGISEAQCDANLKVQNTIPAPNNTPDTTNTNNTVKPPEPVDTKAPETTETIKATETPETTETAETTAPEPVETTEPETTESADVTETTGPDVAETTGEPTDETNE
ncbi:MAG: hypothetical protein IKU45_06320 [Clostridia bacterium]|nr:hypothetical protein [Clostridia bacterium]